VTRAGAPLSRLPRWVRDAGLVAVLAVVVLLAPDRPGPDASEPRAATVTVLLGVVGCALLLARHRAPLLVLGATTALTAVAVVAADGPSPVLVVLAVAAAALASRGDRRTGIAGGLSAAVALWLVVVLGTPATWDSGAPLAAASWVALATAVGDAARSRRAYVEAVEERAERAERTREQEALRRVAEERLRIARELHDSVAHHIAVVNVQAGVAGHLLRSSPDAAADALEHVRTASRTVLDELSSLLGVLRAPGDPVGDTAPVAGTEQLPALVRSAETAGLHVEWRTTGAPRQLPPSVDLVAYRVVQEALTNARKHGDGTALLTVAWSDAGLELEVSNGTRSGAQAATSGHGLVGMRERVVSVSGRLVAEAQHDRFVVRAHLPVGRPAALGAGART
jgi:signal transduction histidine kinase